MNLVILITGMIIVGGYAISPLFKNLYVIIKYGLRGSWNDFKVFTCKDKGYYYEYSKDGGRVYLGNFFLVFKDVFKLARTVEKLRDNGIKFELTDREKEIGRKINGGYMYIKDLNREERIDKAYSLDPKGFKEVCKQKFREQGYDAYDSNINGIDLIVDYLNGKRCAIACKCYSGKNLIATPFIKSFIEVSEDFDSRQILTTGDFTWDAKEYGESQGVVMIPHFTTDEEVEMDNLLGVGFLKKYEGFSEGSTGHYNWYKSVLINFIAGVLLIILSGRL